MLQNEDNQRGDGVCVERATVDHFLSHSSAYLSLSRRRVMYSTYQYIKQYTLLFSTYHALLHCMSLSQRLPKLHLPNTNQPLTYYYARPGQSCLAGQPSKESKESEKSRRSSSPISSGKTAQNEAKPNRIPTETMRIRSTSRAVQGPSDT